jgi:hypothetical protein
VTAALILVAFLLGLGLGIAATLLYCLAVIDTHETR